ncbi:tRNA (adenosine(37)-N6)-threonylcarbamoyltransferase complex ATPase subunit type 1 TsaE [Jeotgalibaca caeni]|uniref:tRNA (adenosine(37)-N6)-threonylcarbamoyltransferase complex ATPase subunit type 1 TsaE n=1 Tax=Jeotgalibaca caeni TaxID=3028623 RepID=UPI00237E1344|nr:tRNA (adenosine(37)-N6)-threonylcarbamoyltransferase complex ATPase subunit type 1 TsaE [Jeotgalibaca caeni]MDE1549027.1 tRNA (adenosine(37)-N6)-threonylcarbamoyltransferase complex ATPase subunit type 1 TsaE [Jeotgalibaca caeni]
MSFNMETTNEQETMAFAKKLGERVEAKDVILLEGELGAGKTTFTKGLALGMGIEQVIKSPTYTLVREYTKGRLPLYHLDVYRLEESGGEELGLEEYFYGEGVSVIEWSIFIKEELPSEYLKIQISRAGEFLQNRFFQIEAVGARYEKLLKEWKEAQNGE